MGAPEATNVTVPSLANFPRRLTLPLLFVGLFILALVLTYTIPWMGTGEEGRPSEWVWGHEFRQWLDGNGHADDANPVGYALTGSIVGLGVSVLWFLLAFTLPSGTLTRTREAALVALLAIPLYFLLLGSARGFALGMQWTSLASGVWGVSIAGIVLLVEAAALAVTLGVLLARRATSHRIPMALLMGALTATALFHAVPWWTENPGTGDNPPTRNQWTDAFVASMAPTLSRNGTDPLDLLGAALLVALILATLWVATSALIPAIPRLSATVDAAFALLLGIPLGLAISGAGRPLGLGLSVLFSTSPGWALSIAGLVFLGLLVAFAWALLATLRDAMARLEVNA